MKYIVIEKYEPMGEYGTKRTLDIKQGEVPKEKFPMQSAWLNTGLVESPSLAQTPLGQKLSNGAEVLLPKQDPGQMPPNLPVYFS
jgi:hypothetical protein